MAQDVKAQAIATLTKAANDALLNKVKDLYKKRIEAAKALSLINEQIESAIADTDKEIEAISDSK